MKLLLYLIIFIFFICINANANIITNLTLKEKEGITTNNYPLTFGHVFKKGDVNQYIAVTYNGTQLQTQCDIKTRYDDGSVKFSIISVILPSIKSASINSISLSTVNLTNSEKFMDKAAILATNIEDEIRLTNLSGSGYSGNLTANLNATLSNTPELTYWLQGSISTELLARQQLNNSLESSWEVRFYPGTSFGPRISHSIENINANFRGIINYDIDIQAGLPALSSRYSKASVQHNENSRWRKVLWIGNKPPETELHYDLAYIISTGAIMNYDTSIIIPESIIASAYSTWNATDHEIMGNGNLQKYFPGTGGRDDIGILPTWTARYLLSMDNRLREIMLNNGEMAAHAPVHFREHDKSKKFFRMPIAIDDRPTVWTNDSNGRADAYGTATDRLPPNIGNVGPTYHGWTVDRAHQGSFAYIPYLITGERYFLDEMQYWASYNLSACDYNPDYGRNYINGFIRDEIRGEGWAFRNIVDAAAFVPDSEPTIKNYYNEKITNNIKEWNSEKDRYPLKMWGLNELHENLSATVQWSDSPWMSDFVLLSLAHADELGFDTSPIISWFGTYIIGRFTHPDFNHYNACPYRFPGKLTDGSLVQTWSQANSLFVNQPSSFPTITTGSSIDDYRFVALAALSVVDGFINGGQGTTARNWLLSQIKNSAYDILISGNPKWSIMPRQSSFPLTPNTSPIIYKIN